jgi:peptidoglycan/xylan/chitin deacetylase (PgdA/CDA1 family)
MIRLSFKSLKKTSVSGLARIKRTTPDTCLELTPRKRTSSSEFLISPCFESFLSSFEVPLSFKISMVLSPVEFGSSESDSSGFQSLAGEDGGGLSAPKVATPNIKTATASKDFLKLQLIALLEPLQGALSAPRLTDQTQSTETGICMRILHLLSQTELTGAEVYAKTLIDSQVRDGHQVFVVSDRMHVAIPISLTSMKISTSSFWQRMKNILALREFLKAHQVEIVHCHSRGAVRHAFWARIGTPVAQVTTLHGRQHFSWSKRFLNIYGEILIAICENVKTAMSRDFNMPASPIRVIRNPVIPASQIAAQTPLQGYSPPHLALIGRSSGPKGLRFEKVVDCCFEKWLSEHPNMRISIIVPNPDKFSDRFHQQVEALKAKHPGCIEILGHTPDLRALLPKYDLVMASGRIAVECILAKVPLLAIGEYENHGILMPQKLCTALQSNFGDIGDERIEIPLRVHEISAEVSMFLRGHKPSAQDLENLRSRVEIEFSPRTVHDEVVEAYRAAIFKRHVPKWIPVLMYHKIPDRDLQSRHRIFVLKDRFQKHLQFFRRRGFQTVTFQDLVQYWTGKRDFQEFPKKPLILTFDDGYIDNLKNAQGILKQADFRAVIFLLANHNIRENTWDADTGEEPNLLMGLEEKLQLDPKVWEIGSHGLNHLHLPQVTDVEVMHEMQESKASLKRDLQQPIYAFAYPFGSTNPHVAGLAKDAGYKFAVNTDQGGLHLADQPQSIFRVNVFPEDGSFELWKKTSSWYRRYFYRKRGR